MRRNRRLATAGLTAVAIAVASAAVVLATAVASADVAPPYFATQNNGSDPHIITCTAPDGRQGYCLYTTQDMGQQYAYPPANYYPMRDIRVYFSTHGGSGWEDKGVAFTEWQLDSWVGRRTDCTNANPPSNYKPALGDHAGNCRAYHLWAPSVVKGADNNYYLYVPDVASTADSGSSNIHTSSRIAVVRSASPFFESDTYLGTVPHSSGYMSDPDVAVDGSNAYLVWADGDYQTCGGFKYGMLQTTAGSGYMVNLLANTTQPINILNNGLQGLTSFTGLGNCDPNGAEPPGPVGRPYVEGASIYKREFYRGHPWTMFFAVKPESVPKECATANGGTGSSNEAIAWASATNPTPGQPWNWIYRGIVMCGSTTEWTNQATITETRDGDLIIVYHDGPATKQRKLHAECLFTSLGEIGGVFRQQSGAFAGFNDCIDNTTAGYRGLWAFDPEFPSHPRLVSTGGGPMTASRYAVGPWEQYLLADLGNGRYGIIALSNGGVVCADGYNDPLTPECSYFSQTGAQFTIEGVPNGVGEFWLKSVATGRYVTIKEDKRLYASVVSSKKVASAARFIWLSHEA